MNLNGIVNYRMIGLLLLNLLYVHLYAATGSGNSLKSEQVQAAGAAKPDLIVSSASPTSIEIIKGSPFSLDVTIKNQSPGHSSSSTIGYYLSDDQTLDAGDLLLKTNDIEKLTFLKTAEVTSVFHLPNSIEAGSYYLIVKADNGNVIQEKDETNNTAAIPLQIRERYYDLAVNKVSLVEAEAKQGQGISVKAEVSNAGTIRAGFYSVFYLSLDKYLDPQDSLVSGVFATLLPGNSTELLFTGTVPATIAAGDYYVIVKADDPDSFPEPDEENNLKASRTKIKITPWAADLAISAASSVNSLYPGQSLDMVYSVVNTGNTDAQSSRVGFYLSTNASLDSGDALLAATGIGPLAAGANYKGLYTLKIPDGIAPGNYYIISQCDDQKAVYELSESNNAAVLSIEIRKIVDDLRIGLPGLTNSSVFAGSEVSVYITAYNDGPNTLSQVKNGIYFSQDETLDSGDILIGIDTIAQIDAGSVSYDLITVNIPAGTPDGNYNIIIKLDEDDVIRETSEDNNSVYANLSVIGQNSIITIPYSGHADVSVCERTVFDHAGYSNYAPNADGTLTIYPADATKNVILYFTTLDVDKTDYLEIFDGTDTTAPSLGKFRSVPNPIVAKNLSGALTLRFKSDNKAAGAGVQATISCINRVVSADLEITDLDKYESRDYLAVYGLVRNIGTDSVPSTDVGFYLSADSIADASDIRIGTTDVFPILGNSESGFYSQISWPEILTGGRFYLIVRADDGDFVNELNEDNNTAYMVFNLSNSYNDISAGSFSTIYDQVAPGGMTPAYATVGNDGTIDMPNVNVAVYLSTDDQRDSSDLLLTTDVTGYLYANAGQSGFWYDVSLPDNVAPGNYYLIFAADYDNLILEVDETNNFQVTPITVVPATLDVSLDMLFPDTDPFMANKPADVEYSLGNNGSVAVNSGIIAFYISTDTILDSNDVLAGSESMDVPLFGAYRILTLSVPDVSSGSYYLIGKADAGNELQETDEQNNVFILPVSIVGKEASLARNSVAPSNAEETAMVYPNPTEGQFNLSFNKNVEADQVAHITLFDAKGILIESRSEAVGGNFLSTFNLSGYASGIYSLRVEVAGKTEMHKVVVK